MRDWDANLFGNLLYMSPTHVFYLESSCFEHTRVLVDDVPNTGTSVEHERVRGGTFEDEPNAWTCHGLCTTYMFVPVFCISFHGESTFTILNHVSSLSHTGKASHYSTVPVTKQNSDCILTSQIALNSCDAPFFLFWAQ